jgi:hypothetical protein
MYQKTVNLLSGSWTQRFITAYTKLCYWTWFWSTVIHNLFLYYFILTDFFRISWRFIVNVDPVLAWWHYTWPVDLFPTFKRSLLPPSSRRSCYLEVPSRVIVRRFEQFHRPVDFYRLGKLDTHSTLKMETEASKRWWYGLYLHRTFTPRTGSTFILIFSYHQLLSILSRFSLRGFLFLLFTVRATCPDHLSLLDFVTRTKCLLGD